VSGAALDRGLSREPSTQLDEWPGGVLKVRAGPGGNCSSSGSAIDLLFWASLGASSLLVALAAAFPPSAPEGDASDAGHAGDDRAAPEPSAPDDAASGEG
jgi:hypothetical protein